MSNVTTASHIQILHGKTSRHDKGYYYETSKGRQKYRTRQEDYQQNRSPKQKWHTLSFVWAHAQIRLLFADPQSVKQIERDYRAAMRRTPDGKVYVDAKGWKFAMLQQQWKTEHPFEPWYEEYLQNISAVAAEKTESESTSRYMLQHQIDLLMQQVNDLRSRLNAQQQ